MIDLTETKTDPRHVPLTATISEQLTRLRRGEAGQRQHVFLPDERQSVQRVSRYFRRAFESACAAAQIHNCTFYTLRHSATSYLVMRGGDIRTVAERYWAIATSARPCATPIS